MPVSTIGAAGLGRPLGVGGISNPVYDLHVLRADGASGTLSLSGSTPTGGPSYVIMGNNDSAGVSGPNVIVSANRTLQFGVGTSFSAAGGGTFTAHMNIDTLGRVTMPGQPSFSAFLTASQAITSNTWTRVNVNTVRWNIGNHFNTSTSLFTAPVAGTYLIGYTIQFESTTTGGYLYSGIQVNGGFYHYGEGRRLNGQTWLGDNTLGNAQLVYLNAGDTAALWAYSEGANSLGGGGQRASFTGYLLG